MAFWQGKQDERERMDRIIRQNPGIRPAELARRLGVSRSNVHRRLTIHESMALHLAAYSRDLLGGLADRIQNSVQIANEAGISDPTFVTLGEEVRAWKLLLDRRFEGVREEVGVAVGEWFASQEGEMC